LAIVDGADVVGGVVVGGVVVGGVVVGGVVVSAVVVRLATVGEGESVVSEYCASKPRPSEKPAWNFTNIWFPLETFSSSAEP